MTFFLTLVAFFAAGDLVWARGGRAHAWWWRAMRFTWAGAMLAGLLAVLVGRQSQTSDAYLPRPVLSAVYVWHLLVLPSWLLLRLGTFASRPLRGAAENVPGDGVSRRVFLAKSLEAAPAIITAGAVLESEVQLESFRVRRIRVPLANLPPRLAGFKIAHLSDLHVGRFTRQAVLEKIVASTNSLKPDLTVFTGDLINLRLADLAVGTELLRALEAQHGVFLCEGNHDLFEDADEFRRQVRRAGLNFLRDEAAGVSVGDTKLQVLGTRWTRGEEDHAAAADVLRSLRVDGAFPVVLTHHPHVFDHAAGFPLVLSGHTHGGQLMLNSRIGFGPLLFRYWSGLYERAGRSLVVSNGAGNWFPVRMRAPAEIILITLEPLPIVRRV